MSRKIFTYFQWGVETNLAKIQNHNTVQGYNSEVNPFKIILFLLLSTDFGPVCDFWQSSSSTWQVLDPTGQLEACCVWWTVLTSPFLPARFHLFSYQLKFFWGASLRAPLGPPGPGALAPATHASRWAWVCETGDWGFISVWASYEMLVWISLFVL